MRIGLRGNLLPESEADYQSLTHAERRYRACVTCTEPFTAENVHSLLGWRETQISGMCEDCFDDLFAEADDGDC